MSNKPAVIQNVSTRSFRSDLTVEQTTIVSEGISNTSSSIDQEFTDVTEGISLSVTAQIEPDDTIRLFILPDVTRIIAEDIFLVTLPDFENTIVRPQVAKQSLFTNIVVNDGDTIVLGGFIDDTYSFQKTGIPFFKDIPFLGRAFENETKVSDKLNLLVFVTVNIMDTQGVAYSRLK
jgi:general secretion pathway protein D